MSLESSAKIVRLPRRTLGTVVPKKSPLSKIGKIALALWPPETHKTARCLGDALGCTERHANLLIEGKRGLRNARMALALLSEIIS
jgi:hypothetical protein